jgi:hypothetical protein
MTELLRGKEEQKFAAGVVEAGNRTAVVVSIIIAMAIIISFFCLLTVFFKARELSLEISV